MNCKTTLIKFTVNGQLRELEIHADISALELIRDILKLKGTKEGCGIGECGACTVCVDGKAVNSCLMFAAQLDGRDILTVEGLATPEGPDPIQDAFLENHAVQCGFCSPGMLMSTHALLNENPNPGQKDISKALAGNLCRCTGYQQIFASVKDAATRCARKEK